MNDAESNEHPASDQEARGDVRLETVFWQYYGQVKAFFLRRGFPEEECHELVQETFLRVYRNLPGFRAESSFETWLFEVTAGVYRNELRKRSARKREAGDLVPLDEEPAEEQGDPLDDVLTGERRKVLLEALVDLPPQMRRCVELRVHQDLKYREIAAVMKISIETVKAQLFQARRLLREKLSGYFSNLDF